MAPSFVPRPLARRIAAFVSCVALLAACGGGGSEPVVDNTPASVALNPSSPLSISSGGSTTITASVTSKSGRSLGAAGVLWSSSDATIASVTGGVVTGAKVGTAVITATAGTATASVSVTVAPGAAAQVALRSQPAGGTIGGPLAAQPVVEIRDAAGNLVPSSSAAVTAAIATGGGVLGGTTTVTAVGGVATFSNLTISGTPGPRTLAFASPGLVSASSIEFTMTPPPTPVIAVDTSSFSLTGTPAANPATHTVTITNAGSAPFTTVTIDPPVYDAGQATGWLGATLTAGPTSFKLALQATSTVLPVGTYHAIVRINAAGASNTPVAISVTLNVIPAVTVAWGGPADKIRVIDAGASFAPALTATIGGQTQPASALTFTSRAKTVATVDATGRITAVGAGQSWIVASLQGVADSVFVNVTRSASGPVLRADLGTFAAKPGDTLTVTFTLDPRTTPVAGATVVIGYETENAMFSVLSGTIPTQTPMPIGAFTSPGVVKISIASGTALAGPVIMAQFKFLARTSGLSGWLTFSVLDIVGPDGSDQSLQTTSTRYPVIIK